MAQSNESTQQQSTSTNKLLSVKNISFLSTPSPCQDNVEEGSQSITSNILQLMSCMISSSSKDIQNYSAYTNNFPLLDVHAPLGDVKDGMDKLETDVDADLFRIQKHGRNEN